MAKTPKSPAPVVALGPDSAPALRAACIDLAMEFLGRETPGKDLTRAQVEEHWKGILSGKGPTRALGALGADGRLIGVALYSVLSGFGRPWLFAQETYVAKAHAGQAEEALAKALVEKAKADGLGAVAASMDASSKAAKALADELGMRKVDSLWAELVL